MDRKNDTAPLNRKCDHCLRSSVRVHFVSARPEVRRFLLAKRILYIHYVFLPLFSREQYGPFPCRLRLVFVPSPCLAGRWMLFIYYLPMTAFVWADAAYEFATHNIDIFINGSGADSYDVGKLFL